MKGMSRQFDRWLGGHEVQAGGHGLSQDAYDRAIANLERGNGVMSTVARVVTDLTAPWIGSVQTVIVQTFHEKDIGYSLSIITADAHGGDRRIIPPNVYAAIIAQYENLKARRRSDAATQAALTRKERGIEPGFLKSKRKAFTPASQALDAADAAQAAEKIKTAKRRKTRKRGRK